MDRADDRVMLCGRTECTVEKIDLETSTVWLSSIDGRIRHVAFELAAVAPVKRAKDDEEE